MSFIAEMSLGDNILFLDWRRDARGGVSGRLFPSRNQCIIFSFNTYIFCYCCTYGNITASCFVGYGVYWAGRNIYLITTPSIYYVILWQAKRKELKVDRITKAINYNSCFFIGIKEGGGNSTPRKRKVRI